MVHRVRRAGQALALLILPILAAAQEPKAGAPKPAKAQTSTKSAVLPVSSDISKEAIVFEHNLTKVVFNAAGTGTRETAVAIRVQSQAGVQALAVLTFPYTSYNDTVELDYVRVRKPDGTVVTTPDYNIQDMPADVTRTAPMYSDIHEKHVTVKALDVGDILEYLVRYRTLKAQVPGEFWYEYTFTKAYITRDEELEITVPREKYVKVSSPDLSPAVKEDGPRKVYAWKTSNLDLKDRDALLKKSEAPKPSVSITTFRSWEEVGRWYDELQRSQVAVTPQIRAKAAELTKGLSSDDDKIRAIYSYVSTRVHYVSLSFGIGRYQPHAAEDVLENEYGDCKDKHTLLAALLKAAGYNAWPALINSSRKLDPEVPSPGQFDHAISVVPRGGAIIWLDTTPAVAPFGLLLANLRDKQALVMPTGKPAVLMTTPSQPPFPTLQTFTAEGALSSDGALTMHVKQTMRGDAEVLYRAAFWSLSPAQWKDLGQRISSASGFAGEVSNVTASAPDQLEKPFEFSYDYTRKDYGTWNTNHQIFVAALPWFGIESASSEQEKPEEPVKLGALGEIVFESKVKLPAGYTPKFADKKDVSEDFADYNATYAINNGVLIATRRLTIKKSEVPVASWDEYKKFCKILSDERDRYIDLVTGATVYPAGEGPNPAPAPGVTAEANPEATKLMQEASEAFQNRDVTRAEEDLHRVAEIDEKFLGLHIGLGWLHFLQNDREGGVREYRKEEEYHPDYLVAYELLGKALQWMKRNDEAMQQYRELLKRDPGNRDAAIALAGMLDSAKKNSEAIDVLEKATEKSPDSSALQFGLAQAYFDNKQPEKGVVIAKKLVSKDTTPGVLNSLAYSMANANTDLDLATEYGNRALREAEAESLKTQDDDAGLANTQLMAHIWDTVGWIYFRRNDDEKALRFLRASWLLSQSSVAGDHLARLYERQGKKQEAAHQYLLALSAAIGNPSNVNKDEMRARYKTLTGQDPSEGPRLSRRLPSKENEPPAQELSLMRTVHLSAKEHEAGSAVFTVVFSPGKAESVKYVSGMESFKSMAGQISTAKANVNAEFPGPQPVHVVRRGILMCGIGGCSFTFLLPDFAHAMDYVPTN